MALYNFILNMWVLNRYTEIQVQNAVAKGYISQQEADEIISTPRTQEG